MGRSDNDTINYLLRSVHSELTAADGLISLLLEGDKPGEKFSMTRSDIAFFRTLIRITGTRTFVPSDIPIFRNL